MRALKGAGTFLAGIVSWVALIFLVALYIKGLAWVSENVHEYLDAAAIIAIAVCVFVLLPCAAFRATYQISAYGLFISSVIFGAATWVLGFLVTLQYWGAIGVFVGVVMGLVGIVPLGILASAFHSDWLAVSQLAFGLALTYGARLTAVMLAEHIDRDEAITTSNSWVIAGVVAGVIAVGALSGVVALSPSNGAATGNDRWMDKYRIRLDAVCSIVADPATFDHQTVTLQGTAAALKETTSRRGNDYTTFKLQDPSGCGALKIFKWGHPAMSIGDHVLVEGVFETEHHEGGYTFYNELVATEVSSLPR